VPYLLIIDKDGKGEDVKTSIPTDRSLTIGRGAASSLRIRDVKMSRVHCELVVADGVTTITDLSSMNGTLVNDERITSVELKHGDLILAGYTCFRYLADEADEPEPEPEKKVKTGPSKPTPGAGKRTPSLKASPKSKSSSGGGVKFARDGEAPKRPVKAAPGRQRAGNTSRAGKGASKSSRAERAEPAGTPDDAGIVSLFGITCDNPDGSPQRGELLCASCRRGVPLKEIKAGNASNIHGQVCCAECLAGDSLIGKTVAGYRIDAKLGSGAWSATYKAEQLSMARSVVFRAIRAELIADRELSTKFLATVKRGGQISHPNLVRMYDIGRTAKRCYASVEYIDGESVKHLMRRKAGFYAEEAAQIMADVAGAVDVAHRQNVLHCDIRPANIILNEERIPKLCGLGFSKVIEDAAAAGSVKVQHATNIVTYWAPERLTNPKRAGKKADVYSLGAVLYAMLAGRPPFEESDPLKLVAMIREARPTSIDNLRKDVPHRLGAVIAKAMAKNPGDRYPGCQFLARDLRKIGNKQT